MLWSATFARSHTANHHRTNSKLPLQGHWTWKKRVLSLLQLIKLTPPYHWVRTTYTRAISTFVPYFSGPVAASWRWEFIAYGLIFHHFSFSLTVTIMSPLSCALQLSEASFPEVACAGGSPVRESTSMSCSPGGTHKCASELFQPSLSSSPRRPCMDSFPTPGASVHPLIQRRRWPAKTTKLCASRLTTFSPASWNHTRLHPLTVLPPPGVCSPS